MGDTEGGTDAARVTGRSGPPDPRPFVAGIVLAAGLGRRFGGAKLAALLEGKPVLAHVLDAVRTSLESGDLARLLVVVGTGPHAGGDAASIETLATSYGYATVENDDPQAGLSRSVRLALQALDATAAGAALMLPGDQPRVRPDAIRALIGRWRVERPGIVIPRYRVSGPGNPVLLDRSVWPLAADLAGDVGMVAIAHGRPDLVTYHDVAGANPDVDTPDELAAFASGAEAP
jgi:molybdenum cofactor cytidylyltransferase